MEGESAGNDPLIKFSWVPQSISRNLEASFINLPSVKQAVEEIFFIFSFTENERMSIYSLLQSSELTNEQHTTEICQNTIIVPCRVYLRAKTGLCSIFFFSSYRCNRLYGLIVQNGSICSMYKEQKSCCLPILSI